MEIVEEIVTEVEGMKKAGRSTDEICKHVDFSIACWNEQMLSRLRIQDLVQKALA